MKSINETRTYNTLFMLMSIDGKISTGSNIRDIDADSKNIDSLQKGRYQYESLERQTDLASFNTGKVMAKIGWNKRKHVINKIPVEFVIVDNKPHLSEQGINNLLRHVKKLYLVTTNSNHPALSFNDPGLEIILFEGQVNFQYLFTKLKSKGIDRVTIQSGGTMNAELIRSDLIDELSIVIAPIMVGGKDTPTIEDGLNIITAEDLSLVGEFELLKAKPLKESFLHLRYSRK